MKPVELKSYGIGHHIIEKRCECCGNDKFVVIDECYCDSTEFDSSEYTYSDEYGACSHCENVAFCNECECKIQP